MRRRRLLGAVLALVVVSTLVVNTGGFTTAAMDRDVSISVASSHDRALVGLSQPGSGSTVAADASTVRDGTATVVVVRNRLSEARVDVTVSARDDGPGSVAVDGSYEGLAYDERAALDATADCAGRTGEVAVPLVVDVTATDGSVSGVVEYTATLTCPAPATTAPTTTTTTTTTATATTPTPSGTPT